MAATKQHTAQQVLTEIKISKSVLRGPQLTRGNVHARIPEQNGKGAHNRLSSAEPKAEMGMEITALGEMEGHSENVVPERKKNRNRKQDPQTVAFPH